MRQRLQEALRESLRSRDQHAAAALRSALGAIDNAEAVSGGQVSETGNRDVAKARLGVGVAEVNRRELSPMELAAILRNEVDERLAAAAEYERLGRLEQAARLRSEAAALQPYLTGAA